MIYINITGYKAHQRLVSPVCQHGLPPLVSQDVLQKQGEKLVLEASITTK
jgi:hypothetical protein